MAGYINGAACIICSRPFRMHGESVEHDRGSVRHASKGRCDSCYRREVRGTSDNSSFIPVYEMNLPTDDPRILAVRHRNIVAGLNRFLLSRRKRGASPDGILMDGEDAGRPSRRREPVEGVRRGEAA